jgi:DNA-binding PadR family transcriptional regulator
MDAQSIILGLLQHKSMTGYEIKKVFSISFAFFSGFSFGSIYPALRKMEENGLISMQMKVQENAPNRKIYTITEKGRETFPEKLRSPLELAAYKSDFLARLFFFSQLEPDERSSVGQQYLEVIDEKVKQLESSRSDIEAAADPFQRQCFEFGIRFFQNLAENVKVTMKSLNEQSN